MVGARVYGSTAICPRAGLGAGGWGLGGCGGWGVGGGGVGVWGCGGVGVWGCGGAGEKDVCSMAFGLGFRANLRAQLIGV